MAPITSWPTYAPLTKPETQESVVDMLRVLLRQHSMATADRAHAHTESQPAVGATAAVRNCTNAAILSVRALTTAAAMAAAGGHQHTRTHTRQWLQDESQLHYTSQEAWYCCCREGPLQTWLTL